MSLIADLEHGPNGTVGVVLFKYKHNIPNGAAIAVHYVTGVLPRRYPVPAPIIEYEWGYNLTTQQPSLLVATRERYDL